MSERLPRLTDKRQCESEADSYRWEWAKLHSDAAYGFNVLLFKGGFVRSHQVAERWMSPHSGKKSLAERLALYLRGLIEVGADRGAVETLADSVCSAIGGRYQRVGDASVSIADACAQVSRETGDVLAAIVAGMQDGALSSEEVAQIRREAREADAAHRELMAAVAALEVEE